MRSIQEILSTPAGEYTEYDFAYVFAPRGELHWKGEIVLPGVKKDAKGMSYREKKVGVFWTPSVFRAGSNADEKGWYTGKSATASAISHMPTVFMEFDTGTYEEQMQSLYAAIQQGLPEPTAIVMSGDKRTMVQGGPLGSGKVAGKGLHVFWRMDTTYTLSEQDQWCEVMRKVAHALNGDKAVTDLARRMRWGGGTGRSNDGATCRVQTILHLADGLASRKNMDQWAASITLPEQEGQVKSVKGKRGPQKPAKPRREDDLTQYPHLKSFVAAARVGTKMSVRCPYHSDSTASAHVHAIKSGVYLSCSVHGCDANTYTYWQTSETPTGKDVVAKLDLSELDDLEVEETETESERESEMPDLSELRDAIADKEEKAVLIPWEVGESARMAMSLAKAHIKEMHEYLQLLGTTPRTQKHVGKCKRPAPLGMQNICKGTAALVFRGCLAMTCRACAPVVLARKWAAALLCLPKGSDGEYGRVSALGTLERVYVYRVPKGRYKTFSQDLLRCRKSSTIDISIEDLRQSDRGVDTQSNNGSEPWVYVKYEDPRGGCWVVSSAAVRSRQYEWMAEVPKARTAEVLKWLTMSAVTTTHALTGYVDGFTEPNHPKVYIGSSRGLSLEPAKVAQAAQPSSWVLLAVHGLTKEGFQAAAEQAGVETDDTEGAVKTKTAMSTDQAKALFVAAGGITIKKKKSARKATKAEIQAQVNDDILCPLDEAI